MKKYELLVVLRSNIGPEKTEEDLTRVKEVLARYEAKIEAEAKWGKRPLPYAIQKNKEGYFVLLNIQLPPAKVVEVTREFRLLRDMVLRALLTEVVQRKRVRKAPVAAQA